MIKRRFCLMVLFLLLTGCGFHLRGVFSMPTSLQVLQILPYQPYDIFQQKLILTLKSNKVEIIDKNLAETKEAAILNIQDQKFSERVIAYGSDAQPNRAILQFKIAYQLIDPHGKIIISNGMVQVERELTLNPNAVLGTENERERLKSDLYLEGALQLVRQLSALSTPDNLTTP